MRYKKPLAATSTLHVVLLEKKPSNLFLPTSAVYKQILTFRDDLRRAVVLEMLLIEFNQLVSKKKNINAYKKLPNEQVQTKSSKDNLTR